MVYRRVMFAKRVGVFTHPSMGGGPSSPVETRAACNRARVARQMSDENKSLVERAREALRHPERDAYAAEKVADMLNRLEDYGSFVSDKQTTFFVSMVERLEGTRTPPAPPERQKTDLGDFSVMVTMFDRAKGAVRAPKVSLRTEEGLDIELSLAGETARAPGTINVATTGGYGNSTWFGRIIRTGAFEASPRAVTPSHVLAMLQTFAASPMETVKAYGHRTGSCALCRRKLTDAKSIAMGVGPVCAKRFLGE